MISYDFFMKKSQFMEAIYFLPGTLIMNKKNIFIINIRMCHVLYVICVSGDMESGKKSTKELYELLSSKGLPYFWQPNSKTQKQYIIKNLRMGRPPSLLKVAILIRFRNLLSSTIEIYIVQELQLRGQYHKLVLLRKNIIKKPIHKVDNH